MNMSIHPKYLPCSEIMAMVKGGAVAAIPGLGGGVDGNSTDNRYILDIEHK